MWRVKNSNKAFKKKKKLKEVGMGWADLCIQILDESGKRLLRY